jgi:hypothetical protein
MVKTHKGGSHSLVYTIAYRFRHAALHRLSSIIETLGDPLKLPRRHAPFLPQNSAAMANPEPAEQRLVGVEVHGDAEDKGDLPYAYNKVLDERRIIDYAEDQHPIGIELLNVSHGVDVRDLPEQAAVERLLEEHHIKVLT